MTRANKKVTIESLARMVASGFGDTKTDINNLRNHVDKRFDEVDRRFDRIEKLILADHKRRLERLETEMKELKNLFAV